MSDVEQQAPVHQDENHIIAERRAKLAEWRKAGLIFPSMPDEDAGREKFLGCYRLLTSSAKRLGVDLMVMDQLQNLQRNVS